MNQQAESTKPRAEVENLVVQTMPDETLVYHTANNTAHCLNKTAAAIWKHCDGSLTVTEIADRAARDLNASVSNDMVWSAIEQFERDNLLQEKVVRPAGTGGMNRRELMRRAGLAAVVAIPLVTSIVAPTAAQAGTGPVSPSPGEPTD